jgi:AraC family transcriptional regulator
MPRENQLQIDFREGEANADTVSATSWRGISVQFSRLQLPAEYEFNWSGHAHYLAYHDLVLIDGEMEVTGEAPVTAGDLRDQMTYVPAGRSIGGWAAPARRMNAFTVVIFDTTCMEDELQSEFNGSFARPHIYFKDAELGQTMRKLGRAMADDTHPASSIYAETVGLTAALEMFRIAQADFRKANASGQLSRIQAKTVVDFIEEHLTRDIGLDDLAAVCGLTRFHFSRAFKATFGDPPHRYLTLKRIEHAKTMLATTRLPISDVATLCGFSNASQFGRSFRDVVGHTPLEFRRRS